MYRNFVEEKMIFHVKEFLKGLNREQINEVNENFIIGKKHVISDKINIIKLTVEFGDKFDYNMILEEDIKIDNEFYINLKIGYLNALKDVMIDKKEVDYTYKSLNKYTIERIYANFIYLYRNLEEEREFIVSPQTFERVMVQNMNDIYYKEDGKYYFHDVPFNIKDIEYNKIILKDINNEVIFGKEV